MTKTEFKLFERVCKKMWRELAKTGDDLKPTVSCCFFCGCPACEIADKTDVNSDWRCKACPITVWRKNTLCPCEDTTSVYEKWKYEDSIQKRKQYAKRISELKWAWMDEYENVKIGKALINRITKYLEAT